MTENLTPLDTALPLRFALLGCFLLGCLSFLRRFLRDSLSFSLASERPMAMACLRLVTFRPERPLFSVPALRFFITRSTSAEAFLEYFRAMMVLPVAGKQSSRIAKVPVRPGFLTGRGMSFRFDFQTATAKRY
jgi:hypothetical protein